MSSNKYKSKRSKSALNLMSSRQEKETEKKEENEKEKDKEKQKEKQKEREKEKGGLVGVGKPGQNSQPNRNQIEM